MSRRKPEPRRPVRVVAAGTGEEEEQAWRQVSIWLWRSLAGSDEARRPVRQQPGTAHPKRDTGEG